eukprot:6043464-Prymnesium_polylepis.1
MFPRPIRTRGAPGATCVNQRTPISPPCGTPRVLIDRYNTIVLPHKQNRHCGRLKIVKIALRWHRHRPEHSGAEARAKIRLLEGTTTSLFLYLDLV